MNASIFWREVECPDRARDVILGADFTQVREVLRGVGYRDTIGNYGIEADQIDYARDRLAADENLLEQSRRALLVIYNATRNGDEQTQVTVAGLHLKLALKHLSNKEIVGSCPLVPVGIAIAKDIHALACK